MTFDAWKLFPYPTLTSEGTSSGSVIDTHPACASCLTRECLDFDRLAVAAPTQCRYGVTYARIDDERAVVGVIQSDATFPSKRHRTRFKQERDRHVSSVALRHAIEVVRDMGPGMVHDFLRMRDAAFEQLKNDPELHKAMADQLRMDLDDTLGQSHDFLQLVKLVRGHAETLLAEKHPQIDPLEAAELEETEGAIYFSTELMLLKMNSLRFIKEPNLANGNERRFSIHPFVLKYVRVYKWQAMQKDIDVRLVGACYAKCTYNDQAIGAVIQSLLDNMNKYAPAGSSATIHFKEHDDHASLTFESLGPRIEPDEMDSIFIQGYRARAARVIEMDGMGVGLATTRSISDVLQLKLSVAQDSTEEPGFPLRYKTRFSVSLRKSA